MSSIAWKILGGELPVIQDECCFLCKDGSHDSFLACDFENCPKVYHPSCLENKHGYPSPGKQLICDWHICFNCKGSSHFQCLLCPMSVCHDCKGKAEFVELRKQRKGFCRTCLNKAIFIENDTNLDSQWKRSGLSKAEINEIVFKDYWEEVRDREGLTLLYLEEARFILNIKLDRNRENSEKFPDEGHKSDANMFAENAAIEKTIPSDSKEKQNVNTSLKKCKSNKKTYNGWGSKELIEFLKSIGQDTSKSLNEAELVGVLMTYIKDKELFTSNKKTTFSCDNDQCLRSFFGRTKVRCKSIRKFLAVHLAANAVSEDENFYGSEDDDVPITEKKTCFDGSENVDVPIMKEKPQNSLDLKIAMRVSERNKSCFASLCENNIKLIYLRRSLVINLLNHPDTFDQKVVGCFVRVKNAPRVHYYEIPKRPYQLGLVTGIKKSSEEYKIKDKCTDILLCVTGLWEDVRISMLSEEAFEEEECNDLVSLVKKGLLERPTIAALEEKVATVHKDIVNHWINKELARLEKAMDKAHMKGWMKEFDELMHQKNLLSTEVERMRRLEEIPEIIADTEQEGNEIEIEVAASNSSQGNRGKTNTSLLPLSLGAKQQVPHSTNHLQKELPKGGFASLVLREDAAESLKVHKEKSTKGKEKDNSNCFLEATENSTGNANNFLRPLSPRAKQQVANSLNDHQEVPPKGPINGLSVSPGVEENMLKCIRIPEEKPTEGATEHADGSLRIHKEKPTKDGRDQVIASSNILIEESSEAVEACQLSVITFPDSASHSQMHNIQGNTNNFLRPLSPRAKQQVVNSLNDHQEVSPKDGSSTEAMDIDKDDSKHSSRKNNDRGNNEEAIKLYSGEDEDLHTVVQNQEGKASHA